MLTIQVDKLVEVLGGQLLAGVGSSMVNGIAIDSREVEAGSAFIVFHGERVDGHTFIPEALGRGARAVVVTRDDEAIRASMEMARHGGAGLVLVADAERALQDLASYHRDRLFCPVVGITGSTGKTTTKDFLKCALSERLRVVATTGNQNNELGVPLTITRAGADTEALVVEVAMRGLGQIARLCEIARPTHGVVTNVGMSHIELLGTQEAIQTAKGELVLAIPADGRVYLNGDDALTVALRDRAQAPVTTYGLSDECDLRAQEVQVSNDGRPSFVMSTPRGDVEVTLAVPGRHNVYNALAAAAVALDLGVAPTEVAKGLGATTASDMRMQVFETAAGVVVINDAYNANPTSMRAALRTLAEMSTTGKRVAVLGDMRELGSLSELQHFEVGETIATLGIDALVTTGELGKRIAEGAAAAGVQSANVRPCATVEEAVEVLDDLLEVGDLVLVKASRAVGLERVIEGIMKPRV